MASNEQAAAGDGLRDCLLPPIPEIFEAAILLSEAVHAHLASDTARADTLIRRADMPEIGRWLDRIWLHRDPSVQALRKVDGLPPVVAKEARDRVRLAPREMMQALIARDGHHCRFCAIPLVRKEVRKELKRFYPEAVRGSSNAADDAHRGLQALWLQYDHVVVHSRGGTTSMDNLVVACPACNFGRDRYMLAEVGMRDPREHVRMADWPGRLVWDGLERLMAEPDRWLQDAGSPFNPGSGALRSR